MTDCNSPLRQPSLYEQQCCNQNKVGKSFKFNDNNRLKIIICPDEIPVSCNEGKRTIIQKIIIMSCVVYKYSV